MRHLFTAIKGHAMDTSTTSKGGGDNDDWETIPQKKDKKKKKKQRPVPLQEFFSSENGGRPGFDGEGVEYREGFVRWKRSFFEHSFLSREIESSVLCVMDKKVGYTFICLVGTWEGLDKSSTGS